MGRDAASETDLVVRTMIDLTTTSFKMGTLRTNFVPEIEENVQVVDYRVDGGPYRDHRFEYLLKKGSLWPSVEEVKNGPEYQALLANAANFYDPKTPRRYVVLLIIGAFAIVPLIFFYRTYSLKQK